MVAPGTGATLAANFPLFADRQDQDAFGKPTPVAGTKIVKEEVLLPTVGKYTRGVLWVSRLRIGGYILYEYVEVRR